MAIEIVMPRMGLTMEEGTLAAWLKKNGEYIRRGEPLFEIETDKTTMEIESPGEGFLGGQMAQPGESFPVGAVIGYLLAEGETLPDKVGASATVERETTRSEKGKTGGKVRASPAARRLALELNIDLREVRGTGPGGRIVVADVEERAPVQATAIGLKESKASPLARRVASELGVDMTGIAGTGPGGRITRSDIIHASQIRAQPRASSAKSAPAGNIIPVSRAHGIMANRMTTSFGGTPHFYLHSEVDAREIIGLRETLLPWLEDRAGVRITYTDILIKLCAVTLRRHPRAMAQWKEDSLYQPENVNIGVAVDVPTGLIVPVIRDADQLGLAEIAQCRTELVERAREGRLLLQHLELGVFTLTNLGMYPIDSFDPIINPPQAAILAVGRIKERALVERGEIIPVPMMKLSLAIDHRVLDGAAGARFLADLVELIEKPTLLLT